MTPFLQFRVWLRRGPLPERVSAGVAVLIVVALLGWALVPVDTTTRVEAASGRGPRQGQAAPAGTGGAHVAPGKVGGGGGGPSAGDAGTGGSAAPGTPAGTPGAGPDAGSGSGTAPASGPGARPVAGADAAAPGAPAPAADGAPEAAAPGNDGSAPPTGDPAAPAPGAPPAPPGPGTSPKQRCDGLRATDQGVTASEILVAVPILSLGGDVGNETFGVRGDLEAVAQAAADGVNASGGVACRDFRIKTYRVNPLDPNEQRSVCLQIASDKPFSVIDFGGYLTAASRSCFVEHQIPYQASLAITEEEADRSYPYMYGAAASADQQLRNWVFEAAARGTFEKGFEKLGILQSACEPKINDELRRNLNSVGVSDDQMSIFTLSCTAVAPPSQLAQAAAQHRQDGVSHVFFAASAANGQSYVRNADSVGFVPTYLASDFGAVTNTTSEDGWSEGFDGTVAITSDRLGEINSGISHPLIAPCQAWYEEAGVAPPEADGDPAFFFCTLFRLFQATGNAAGPNLTRTSLVTEGLPRVGRFESTTSGDAIFDRPGKVTGGDYIRAMQWHADCACWKVLDQQMKPAR